MQNRHIRRVQMGSDKTMNILFLTDQSFHPEGRKASTHFLASGLQRLGHEVYVMTVGVSLPRLIMAPQRNKGALAYRKWTRDPDRLWKRVKIDLVHRPARDSGLLSRILARLSSDRLPKAALREIGQVDAVIVSSGLAVAHFDFIRKFYPSVRILYNAADALSGVGYSGHILERERDALTRADVVRTPSTLLAKTFTESANWVLIPHGVDKTVLLEQLPSPYPANSSNAVLVGSTLLDWDALLAIARAIPETQVHVFGVADRAGVPENLILHGEVAFDSLAPYMQHASFALAPYKLAEHNAYIAESSLKIRQYRLCGLPIVCPHTLAIEGDDVLLYDPEQPATIADALERAKARGKQPYEGQLPDWSDVARQIDHLLTPPPPV